MHLRITNSRHAFTLLEVLLALGIIIILLIIVAVTIKPQQILQKGRDTQRITELANLRRAIGIAIGSDPLINIGTTSVVYLSLPDTVSTCITWTAQLPALPVGWTYHCVAPATYKKADGSGWLPINFADVTALNLDTLVVDPNNQPPYYFTYVAEGMAASDGYELTAAMESPNNRGEGSQSAKDGGTNNFIYEIGDNLQLTPAAVENRATSTSP